jgi:energy-coupling factor transporter ATP-binding protein EcfA2
LDSEPLFRVRNGKEIIINPETNIDTVFLRYLILYQGFGTLLMQRGNLVLHASSINIKDKAVAFLGWCGEGKSTIAAAMNKMNYSTITDDVLAIGFDKQNRPYAFPSFPRVKLCEDVSKYITTEMDVALPIIPEIEKYSYNVYKTFSVKPIPLETIYILKQNTKNQIISLKLQDALIELIKNCYTINLFDDAKRSENLNQCVELVKQIPIKCLERSQSLDEIWSLIQLIENDVCSN